MPQITLQTQSHSWNYVHSVLSRAWETSTSREATTSFLQAALGARRLDLPKLDEFVNLIATTPQADRQRSRGRFIQLLAVMSGLSVRETERLLERGRVTAAILSLRQWMIDFRPQTYPVLHDIAWFFAEDWVVGADRDYDLLLATFKHHVETQKYPWSTTLRLCRHADISVDARQFALLSVLSLRAQHYSWWACYGENMAPRSSRKTASAAQLYRTVEELVPPKLISYLGVPSPQDLQAPAQRSLMHDLLPITVLTSPNNNVPDLPPDITRGLLDDMCVSTEVGSGVIRSSDASQPVPENSFHQADEAPFDIAASHPIASSSAGYDVDYLLVQAPSISHRGPLSAAQTLVPFGTPSGLDALYGVDYSYDTLDVSWHPPADNIDPGGVFWPGGSTLHVPHGQVSQSCASNSLLQEDPMQDHETRRGSATQAPSAVLPSPDINEPLPTSPVLLDQLLKSLQVENDANERKGAFARAPYDAMFLTSNNRVEAADNTEYLNVLGAWQSQVMNASSAPSEAFAATSGARAVDSC